MSFFGFERKSIFNNVIQ